MSCMTTTPSRSTVTVGIVGGGPAGLMLSHLLARQGIDSVVVDNRSYTEIEHTVRAGILEADSVAMLVETGVSDRVLREGDEHGGIELGFDGRLARIDFVDLVGSSVWLYPQTEVFIDLPRLGPGTAETSASASATQPSPSSPPTVRCWVSPMPRASPTRSSAGS